MRANRSLWIFAARSLAIVVLLGGLAAAAFGQSATGTITGTATDAQGAAMPGVRVLVHNTDTGLDQRPVTTNDSGLYLVPLLPPGNYDVTASQAGFATMQHKGVVVQVGQTVRIDIGMSVAAQESLVTVTAETPLIETEKTEASQTVSENLVSDLPISSRRWEQFVLLTPGLTTDGASGLISYHGFNSQYNQNSVDGANNNNNYQSQARGGTNDGYVYSSDAVKEFRVASNNYNAEIGQAAGGAINAVTKSGTSQMHGDLFYNMRNPIFNALDPVTAANAATNSLLPTQPVHQQNQFGGAVGGPLIKDRIFYYVNYDGYRKVSPITYTTSQKSPAIVDLACPLQITTAQCAAAKNYILIKNLGTFPRELVQDVALAKLDFQLNSANHVTGTFNWRNWAQPNGTAFAASNNSGLTTANGSNIHDRFVIGTWNTVIGSDKVNQLLYQFGQDHSFSTFRDDGIAPGVTLSQMFGYGFRGVNPQHIGEDRNQVSDTFSFNKGRHAFKTGADFNFTSTDVRSGQNVSGLYTYSTAVIGSLTTTQFTAATGCPASGNGALFCDWLLDLYGKNINDGRTGKHWSTFAQSRDIRFPGNEFNEQAAAIILKNQDYAFFFQDTWKLRPNVTLNVGLRYDLQILPQLDAPCDKNTPLLEKYTCSTPNDHAGIQPRFGLAWSFTPKTVVRLGFGSFFAKTSVGIISSAHRTTGVREQAFNCTPTGAGAAGLCAGLIFPNVLYAQQATKPGQAFTDPSLGAPGTTNGNPLMPTILNPPGDNCFNNAQCGVRGVSPDLQSPRALHGSIAIERQLPGNMSFSGSYVFTRGTHLPSYWDVNMAPPTTKTYDVLSSATAPATTVLSTTVPFFTTRLEPVVAGGPVGTGPVMAVFSEVSSWYHGMLLTLRKPMSHSVEFVANYTLSKATDTGETSSNNGGEVNFSNPGILNPYDRSGERGISGLDNRHRFTGSVVWAPAFAKNYSSMIARGALNGWTVSSTVTATSGNPFSALVSSAAVQPGGLNGGMTAAMLDASAFAMAGRVAWLPRDSYTLPNYNDVDLRVAKTFSLHERFNFEFRGEAFNLFNSTIVQGVNQAAYNYVAAGTGVCAGHANTCMVPVSTFLGPTTTSGNLLGARQLQFGFRFGF